MTEATTINQARPGSRPDLSGLGARHVVAAVLVAALVGLMTFIVIDGAGTSSDVEAPALVVPSAAGSYSGDWKDLVVPSAAGSYSGDWKDLVARTG